jgi:hypothetical protein
MTWDELQAAATDPDIKGVRRRARRKVRYWMFRLQKQADEASRGNEHNIDGIPDGLREHYEDTIGFAGWENFGVNWDVRGDLHKDPEGSFLDIIPRRFSIHQEWNSQLLKGAKTLGGS